MTTLRKFPRRDPIITIAAAGRWLCKTFTGSTTNSRQWARREAARPCPLLLALLRPAAPAAAADLGDSTYPKRPPHTATPLGWPGLYTLLIAFTHPALSPGKLLCPHPILNSVCANLFAQGGKFGGKGGMGGWFDLGPLAATPHPPCLRPVGPPNFLCHRQKRKSLEL